MPQAYVRRSAPGEKPVRRDLLDWSEPQDHEELLAVLYGGDSVLIQHEGEPLLGRPRRGRHDGSITSMSTTVGLTSSLLEELDLRPGNRVLDIGTGAGVTSAVACYVCGAAGVVTLDRDPHVSAAARASLGALGYRPTVVCGSGEYGWPERGPYDRILLTFALPYVPQPCVEQLAPGGKLLVNVVTTSPSWPALAVVTRSPGGRVDAELRAVEFAHLAGHGIKRVHLPAPLRERLETGRACDLSTSRSFRSDQAPPAEEAGGFWLALDALHPGLVRHWGVEGLALGAPGCGSWMTARPDGTDSWSVTTSGPRDIWAEIHQTAARWQAADAPAVYHLTLEESGEQRVSAGHGTNVLAWRLPPPSAPADHTTSQETTT
ncbi:methyltransferase domain-containing protein [Streptomyces diacarni]|uniref:methyltransferase domain-containing protein n=1 Tax=Streptomyces diacarni TaxID=2800381 RepID=UPI0034076104